MRISIEWLPADDILPMLNTFFNLLKASCRLRNLTSYDNAKSLSGTRAYQSGRIRVACWVRRGAMRRCVQFILFLK